MVDFVVGRFFLKLFSCVTRNCVRLGSEIKSGVCVRECLFARVHGHARSVVSDVTSDASRVDRMIVRA